MQSEVELLILVIAANGAPIVAENLLGRHWAWPLRGPPCSPFPAVCRFLCACCKTRTHTRTHQ